MWQACIVSSIPFPLCSTALSCSWSWEAVLIFTYANVVPYVFSPVVSLLFCPLQCCWHHYAYFARFLQVAISLLRSGVKTTGSCCGASRTRKLSSFPFFRLPSLSGWSFFKCLHFTKPWHWLLPEHRGVYCGPKTRPTSPPPKKNDTPIFITHTTSPSPLFSICLHRFYPIRCHYLFAIPVSSFFIHFFPLSSVSFLISPPQLRHWLIFPPCPYMWREWGPICIHKHRY